MSRKALRHQGPLSGQGPRLKHKGWGQSQKHPTCIFTQINIYKLSKYITMWLLFMCTIAFLCSTIYICLFSKFLRKLTSWDVAFGLVEVLSLISKQNRFLKVINVSANQPVLSLKWQIYMISRRLNKQRFYFLERVLHDIWLLFPAYVCVFALWLSGGDGG